MASMIHATALINGKRIEIRKSGDDATVHAAMADFFGQIGAALAENVSVKQSPVRPRRRRRKEPK